MRQPFDRFEVARVGEYADPRGGTFMERDDTRDYEEDDECIGTIITVYGVRRWPDPMPEETRGYGLTAISDFEDTPETILDAVDLAYALAAGARDGQLRPSEGWPVDVYVR